MKTLKLMKKLFENLFLLKGTRYAEVMPSEGSIFLVGKVRYLNSEVYDPSCFWVDDFDLEDVSVLGHIQLNPGYLDEQWRSGVVSFFTPKESLRSAICVRLELTNREGEVSLGPIKQVVLQTHRVILDQENKKFVQEGDHKWWNFVINYLRDVIMLPYDSLEDSPIEQINIGPIGEVWSDMFKSSFSIS